jgi:Domain of unknown function (DUF4386)
VIVSGDAAATAASILGQEQLFRLSVAADLVAGACYVAATLFVYDLLKPVSRNVSLLAAFFSLVGCAAGAVNCTVRLAPLAVLDGAPFLSVFTGVQQQALAYLFLRWAGRVVAVGFLFFGLHCLLVGILILRSTFLPRLVGALMVLAGLGWLSFSLSSVLLPPLARSISSYVTLPGLLGEGSLTLWLLVMGVNVERWTAQARSAGRA